MNRIESFANSGGSPEPLRLASPGGPVVLCTPAFAGAFVGLTVNYALDKAVDWYARHYGGGGHFAPVGDSPGWAGDVSSDVLLESLVARF
jgi:hypothetical protein